MNELEIGDVNDNLFEFDSASLAFINFSYKIINILKTQIIPLKVVKQPVIP